MARASVSTKKEDAAVDWVELAIADRRSAIDAASQVAKWLVGTALLLNGGGLLAVINRAPDPEVSAKAERLFEQSALLFAVGTLSTLCVGLIALSAAMNFVWHANETIEAGKPIRTPTYITKYFWMMSSLVAYMVAAACFVFGAERFHDAKFPLVERSVQVAPKTT